MAITAEGLVKRFGDRRVVDGIDIAVPAGAIYGVLGPNGAGKTTTLRMLLGIIEPDAGTRTLLGHARPRDASDRVGYLPEERGLYPAMKAREAIAFMGALRGLDWRTGRARAAAMFRLPSVASAFPAKSAVPAMPVSAPRATPSSATRSLASPIQRSRLSGSRASRRNAASATRTS